LDAVHSFGNPKNILGLMRTGLNGLTLKVHDDDDDDDDDDSISSIYFYVLIQQLQYPVTELAQSTQLRAKQKCTNM
jgi:hypothetical protein